MDVIMSPDSGLTGDARYLAIALLKFEGTKGCFPSLDTLVAAMGKPRRKIVEWMKELESATGAVRLSVKRACRKDGPGRAPNEYTLIVDLSSAGEFSSGGEQSSGGEFKSTELSSDLSSETGVAEFTKSIHLSSPVAPVYHSVTHSIKTQGERARGRATLPPSLPSVRKTKTELPEGWQPNDTHRALAKELRVLGMFDDEIEKFRLNAREKGKLSEDWDAAAELWLHRAERFAEDDELDHQRTPEERRDDRTNLVQEAHLAKHDGKELTHEQELALFDNDNQLLPWLGKEQVEEWKADRAQRRAAIEAKHLKRTAARAAQLAYTGPARSKQTGDELWVPEEELR